MKEKIILFIVGLLLGAIISTGSIYFYTVATKSNNNQNTFMNGENIPNMPNGEMPEMPNDMNFNGGPQNNRGSSRY